MHDNRQCKENDCCCLFLFKKQNSCLLFDIMFPFFRSQKIANYTFLILSFRKLHCILLRFYMRDQQKVMQNWEVLSIKSEKWVMYLYLASSASLFRLWSPPANHFNTHFQLLFFKKWPKLRQIEWSNIDFQISQHIYSHLHRIWTLGHHYTLWWLDLNNTIVIVAVCLW